MSTTATPPADLPVGVIGGTGRTGQAVADALRRAGRAVVQLSRRPIAEGGHPHRRLDLTDPASAREALRGIRALYVVPPRLHPAEDRLAVTAFHAAAQAGVQRVVYHSVMHPTSPGVPHHARKATAEAALRGTGLTWTVLQPNTYAQNVLSRIRWHPGEAHLLSLWPVDAPAQAPVDLLDVAAAAAVVLDDPAHAFATYELAGPELLTPTQMADRLGRAWQVRAVARQAGLAELPAASTDLRHLSDHYAYHAHYADHGFPGSPFVLESLLGQPATKLVDVLRRHRPDDAPKDPLTA